MYLRSKHLPRRTVLKGVGVTLALPFLDAMVPAARAWTESRRIRLACIEIVHGSRLELDRRNAGRGAYDECRRDSIAKARLAHSTLHHGGDVVRVSLAVRADVVLVCFHHTHVSHPSVRMRFRKGTGRSAQRASIVLECGRRITVLDYVSTRTGPPPAR